MRVCDVVLNSIWYDPRVRKQIIEYKANDVEVSCVGLKCNRYNAQEVQKIPCQTTIVEIPHQYDGKQRSIFGKLRREVMKFQAVKKAIIEHAPEVIHANDFNALLPAYAAAKKLGCKLVYDSHEIYVETYLTNKKYYIAPILKLIEGYIVRRVNLMVSVSNAAADYFMRTYHIKKPLVVTNCVLQKDVETIDYGAKSAGFEVLNHGQFYRGRGYEIMAASCDLIREYPEIRLAIRGYGALEEEMRMVVSKSLNKDAFVFYPPVKVHELIPMAARSHVGVAITEPICLNFKLSVSNKLFEYAAAGLPVIMSDIPEHRYLNDKYDFGLILEENSPRSLADAIIRLYTDTKLFARLAQNARRMSDKVTWENEFAQLVDAEQNMLS